MKTRVLSVDLAGAQGGILHFRGERMGNWITKNAQANRGINVVREILPLLKISECVALGGLHVFHVIPNEVRDLTQRRITFSDPSVV
jgi:hypothetical protein